MPTVNQTAFLKPEGKSNSSKKPFYMTRFILLHDLIPRSVIIFPVDVCTFISYGSQLKDWEELLS